MFHTHSFFLSSHGSVVNFFYVMIMLMVMVLMTIIIVMIMTRRRMRVRMIATTMMMMRKMVRRLRMVLGHLWIMAAQGVSCSSPSLTDQ